MARYIAIVDGADPVWGARMPDFPGCHGGGATMDEAVDDLKKALSAYVSDMIADGEKLPAPTEPESIWMAIDEGREVKGILFSIPLLIDRGQPVRANISLDAGLLMDIDAEAKKRGLTRSAFLADAARDKIAASA